MLPHAKVSAEEEKMKGDPTSVSSIFTDEGSNPNLSLPEDSEILNISIQADAGISTQGGEYQGISKINQAGEGKVSASSQADEDERSFSFHVDEGVPSISLRESPSNPNISSNVCVTTHANSAISANSTSGPCILATTEVIQLNISARADRSIHSFQETVNLLEKVENKVTVEAVRARNYLLNPSDVTMEDGPTEGKFASKLSEETPTAIGKPKNAASAFGNPGNDTRAHDESNEEFLPIGNYDDRVADEKQLKLVDGVRCGGEEAMQQDGPWEAASTEVLACSPEPEDANRRSSLKRSRSNLDNTPSVQVIYKRLTSESKNKLKELLQKWALWHGEYVGIEVVEKGPLESGDETYFPPLQVGGQNKATMSFWMDKPLKQARIENTAGDLAPASQAREIEVPLYDRAGTGALISTETQMSLEGGLDHVDEGSRCFNCGAYSHSLKECPRPRDNNAINSARKLMAEKRGSANGSRAASRYYQNSPGGKFDDLRPGILGNEIRQLLGIGELDPPPWLNRMRELGYPPGYLEDQEEEQSGITIFGTSDNAEGSFIGEDGEILGEIKKRSMSKKMVVHFPGVNAPIPDDADRRTWGSPADFGNHDRASHRVASRQTHTSSFSAAAVSSDGTVYTGTEDWEGPPGSGHDYYPRSSKIASPGFEGASYSNSFPWQPHEQSRLGKAPLARSPILGRSGSDSGRSPKVMYDEPHSLPPLGGLYSSSRHSPLHSSRPYLSPSTPNQRFPHGQQNREDESRRRAWSQAHDALHSMHRSDRPSPARRR